MRPIFHQRNADRGRGGAFLRREKSQRDQRGEDYRLQFRASGHGINRRTNNRARLLVKQRRTIDRRRLLHNLAETLRNWTRRSPTDATTHRNGNGIVKILTDSPVGIADAIGTGSYLHVTSTHTSTLATQNGCSRPPEQRPPKKRPPAPCPPTNPTWPDPVPADYAPRPKMLYWKMSRTPPLPSYPYGGAGTFAGVETNSKGWVSAWQIPFPWIWYVAPNWIIYRTSHSEDAPWYGQGVFSGTPGNMFEQSSLITTSDNQACTGKIYWPGPNVWLTLTYP